MASFELVNRLRSPQTALVSHENKPAPTQVDKPENTTASFTISFRIGDVTINGRTYEDRYNKLVETLKAATKGKFWDQTTSYFAIQSVLTIDELVARCKAAIAVTADLVLVLDADQKSGRITGSNDDDDIFTIIPYLKKA